MSYAVLDIETGIRTLYKRKATPFYQQNPVVAVGYKKANMAKAAAYYSKTGHLPDSWWADLLRESSMLVGFNLKFDILHIIQNPANYLAYQTWVAGGGKIYDAQLAEYLLTGMTQENHWLSLDEVAPRYGGHLKDDAVKALWTAGVDTPDIDKDMLLEYLIGKDGGERDLGDIGNTEKVFLGQVKALRERGQLQSVMLNMDAELFVIEVEHNGMKIDKALGLQIAGELVNELRGLRDGLQKELPADLPFEFNWGSRFHLSALIFGGHVKYKAKAAVLDEDGNAVYYQRDEVQPVLDEAGQPVRYAGGKNKGEIKTKKVKVPDLERGPKTRFEDFYYTFPGYTAPDPEWATSTEGVYSTSGSVIEALADTGIPFLESLSRMSSLQKDLGTYYQKTDEDTGETSGMLTLVGPDGLIHHSINQVSTVTARFSSSDPNLQSVSSGNKSKVKSLFVSRFDNGKIIQSDFTALEVYVQAVLTGDHNLLADLHAGVDMHCMRASAWKGVPYADVLAMAKDENNPEYEKWHYIRKAAKIFSFQRAYGAGVAKIAKYTGMPEEEVQALADAEDARYSEVPLYYDLLTQQIKENRTPTSRFVQHPAVPGLTCQLGRSYATTPDGKVYSYTEHPAPEWALGKGRPTTSFSPTEIKNYVVQGTGAEWMKAAMALMVRMFYKRGNFGGRALLVNTVHDAAYVDAAPDVAIPAAQLMTACMYEASAYMSYLFSWDIPIEVPAETKMGSSMIEEDDPPAGWKGGVPELRTEIRKTFTKNYIPYYERKN